MLPILCINNKSFSMWKCCWFVGWVSYFLLTWNHPAISTPAVIMRNDKIKIWLEVQISGHGPTTSTVISTSEPKSHHYQSLIGLHWASWVIFIHVKNSLFCNYLLNNRRLLGFFAHSIFKAEVHDPAHNPVNLLSFHWNLLQTFSWNWYGQKWIKSDALQGPSTCLIHYMENSCPSSFS